MLIMQSQPQLKKVMAIEPTLKQSRTGDLEIGNNEGSQNVKLFGIIVPSNARSWFWASSNISESEA